MKEAGRAKDRGDLDDIFAESVDDPIGRPNDLAHVRPPDFRNDTPRLRKHTEPLDGGHEPLDHQACVEGRVLG